VNGVGVEEAASVVVVALVREEPKFVEFVESLDVEVVTRVLLTSTTTTPITVPNGGDFER